MKTTLYPLGQAVDQSQDFLQTLANNQVLANIASMICIVLLFFCFFLFAA